MFTMEREYRILIDVGKFAVYQTDWWFFVCFFFSFASCLTLMLCGGGGAGHALNLLPRPPGLYRCRPSGQGPGHVQLQGPRSELLLRLSEIPGKRVKEGTLAESVALELSRMVAEILLLLFSLVFLSFSTPLD